MVNSSVSNHWYSGGSGGGVQYHTERYYQHWYCWIKHSEGGQHSCQNHYNMTTGVKTFTDGIVSDVTGDLNGTATDLSSGRQKVLMVVESQSKCNPGSVGTSLNIISDKL